MTTGVVIAWLLAVVVIAVLAYFVGYTDGQIATELRHLHEWMDSLEDEWAKRSDEISEDTVED